MFDQPRLQVPAETEPLPGFATDICVQLTAMDAVMRGFDVWVPADCTAAESTREKSAALRYLQRVLKVDVSNAL